MAADRPVGGHMDGTAAPPGAHHQDARAADPRIEELRAAGLNELWMEIAEIVGFDRFLAAWSVLDQADTVLDDRRRVPVPSLHAIWLRHQRRVIIQRLGAAGLSPREIHERLPTLLRQQISVSTISREMHRE